MTFDRYTAPGHRAAVLAAAVAVAVGVAVIVTSGGGSGQEVARRATSASATPPAPPGAKLPDTPAGAVTAATALLQTGLEAFFDGTWRSVYRKDSAGPLQAIVEHEMGPVWATWQSRVVAAHVPYVARFWPLGYAVQQYSATAARVQVWLLFVLAVSNSGDATAWLTGTVSVSWTHGGWRLTAMPSGPDLAPPGHNATATQVASWIDAADRFHGYHYVP